MTFTKKLTIVHNFLTKLSTNVQKWTKVSHCCMYDLMTPTLQPHFPIEWPWTNRFIPQQWEVWNHLRGCHSQRYYPLCPARSLGDSSQGSYLVGISIGWDCVYWCITEGEDQSSTLDECPFQSYVGPWPTHSIRSLLCHPKITVPAEICTLFPVKWAGIVWRCSSGDLRVSHQHSTYRGQSSLATGEFASEAWWFGHT